MDIPTRASAVPLVAGWTPLNGAFTVPRSQHSVTMPPEVAGDAAQLG